MTAMSTSPTPALTLDFRALRCPMPLLKLKQALHRHEPGTELVVLTTDTGASRDIPAFLQHTAHQLVSVEVAANGAATFTIISA